MGSFETAEAVQTSLCNSPNFIPKWRLAGRGKDLALTYASGKQPDPVYSRKQFEPELFQIPVVLLKERFGSLVTGLNPCLLRMLCVLSCLSNARALLLVACNRARVLAEDALGGALLTRHVIRMLRQTSILHYFTVLCLHQTGEGINFASPCKCLLKMLYALSCVPSIQAPSACSLKFNPYVCRGCSVCRACVSTRQVKD